MLTPAGMTRAHDKLTCSCKGKKIKATHALSVAPTKWTLNFKMCKCFIHYGKFFPKIYIAQLMLRKDICTESKSGHKKNCEDFIGWSESRLSEQRGMYNTIKDAAPYLITSM